MRYFLIILFALLTACGSTIPTIKPFKMDIQQGNVVTSKMLLQLRPGMTKSQVKFIMGSPLIIDSFHKDRWDYFYQLRQAGKIVEQRRVILDFDKELLTKVRGDVVPEGSPSAASGGAATGNESSVAKTITVEPKPKQEDGMLDKLKFWKEDEKATAVTPVAKTESAKPAEEKSWTDKLKFWKKDDVAKEMDAVKTTREKTDALEANSSAAAGDAPLIDVPNDMPNIETPSVLAVPIGGVLAPDAPAVETPTVEAPITEAPITQAPPVEEPVVTAPLIEAAPVEMVKPTELPKVEELKIQTPAPTPVPTPVPMPAAKAGERLIFRMDRNLDLKNLDLKNLQAPIEAAPAPEAPNVENNVAPTSSKSKKLEQQKIQPPPTEEAPGYFERMLEKIGF